MTTTPPKRRPAARKTREADATVPATPQLGAPVAPSGAERTDRAAKAPRRAGTDAAVNADAAKSAAAVTAAAPVSADAATNDAVPAKAATKPARKRASASRAAEVETPQGDAVSAVADADADADALAVASSIADARVDLAEEAASAKKRPARKRGAAVADAAGSAEPAAAAAMALPAAVSAPDAANTDVAPQSSIESGEAASIDATPKAAPSGRRRKGASNAKADAIADVAEANAAHAAQSDDATNAGHAAEVVENAEAASRNPENAIPTDGSPDADTPARKGRRKPRSESQAAPAPEPVVPAPPAEPPRYTLGPREDDGVFGDYELRDSETAGTFRLRLLGRHTWRCDCAGYAALGQCEHGGHLLAMLDEAHGQALDAGWPAREAEVWLVPGPERQVQWVCGQAVPERLRDQAGLDEQERRAAEGAHEWLGQVLSEARALGVTLRVDAPVWPQLAWGRDAQARVHRLETLMADGDAMRSLLRDELPVHAWEAALFAVCAGRALLADDLGLGQRGAAIAAIRLGSELFGVKPALVIAPEAAHAAWRRDLQRWLGDAAATVTLAATPPAKLVPALVVVDGIESIGAELLATLRALPAAQLLLIAHQEPLGDARLAEWIDWLDEARRGPFAQLQALPADAGKKQKREALLSVVLSRRRRELTDSLPGALLSPLWLDAAGTSLPAAPLKQLRQLIERWSVSRYLGSAEQQQLLEALALLPPASRQALAAKAEAVLALRREWIQGAVPAAVRLVVCARSETLLESLSLSPQLRRLPPQRLRAGDSAEARTAALAAWRAAEAGVLLASDDALASLADGELANDRVALVHADLPWRAEVLDERLVSACGDAPCGIPSALLLIEGSLDAAVLRAQRDGVAFPDWLDAAPAWLDADQAEALMTVLPGLIEGL